VIEDASEKRDKATQHYLKSERGKQALRKYQMSGKGRQARKKYLDSEKGKQAQLRYYYSPKAKKLKEEKKELRRLAVSYSKWLESNQGKSYKDFLISLKEEEGNGGEERREKNG
jgi:hypothetical protein